MTQAERRMYLIKALLAEQPKYRELSVPEHPAEQKRLLRSLMNVRVPNPIGRDFLAVQDDYLQEETARKGITDISDLTPVSEGIYLWQGDMTTLRCDAIVNAANSAMTGCYVPCHGCIDNCIHTYAGIQLRQECAAIMGRQKREEEPGSPAGTGRSWPPATAPVWSWHRNTGWRALLSAASPQASSIFPIRRPLRSPWRR